jgi:TPR repeat protein
MFRKLIATLCLTVFLVGPGVCWAADFQKGFDAAMRGDFVTALKEWRPLAEQGNAVAQFSLGSMYENGQGVPQDYKTAVKWYTLAAEQGDADAQGNLGVMYDEGQGVPQDYVRAHMWYNLSASAGEEGAIKNRDAMAEQMTPADISAAQKLARECFAKNYKVC